MTAAERGFPRAAVFSLFFGKFFPIRAGERRKSLEMSLFSPVAQALLNGL
jgi:hypothetical protein